MLKTVLSCQTNHIIHILENNSPCQRVYWWKIDTPRRSNGHCATCKSSSIWQWFIMATLREVTGRDKTRLGACIFEDGTFSKIGDGTHSQGPQPMAIGNLLLELVIKQMTLFDRHSISSKVSRNIDQHRPHSAREFLSSTTSCVFPRKSTSIHLVSLEADIGVGPCVICIYSNALEIQSLEARISRLTLVT